MSEAECKLVVISGRSGSGKSTALHVLEDAGYYCIDNLPAGLLPQLVDQACAGAGDGLQQIAVGIDARNIHADISRFPEIIDSLPDQVSSQVVYLDADDSCLLKRFSETRRRHPLSNDSVSLPEALATEGSILQPIASCAALSIDTSQLTLHDLRDLVNRSVVRERDGMAVLIESFGFRNGPPINADLVFDVRCLPNPHWVPALRAHTGLDREVIEFLAAETEVSEMLADIQTYLDKWLPRFAGSNRSYVTIAIGCTGGRHRSVYLCERLFAHLHDRFQNVQIRHRELGRTGPGNTSMEKRR